MKKDKNSDKVRLNHIIEAIEHIELFMNGITEQEYYQDLKLQSAIERKIEIIGEASNHLSEELISNYPKIEWYKIRGFRNILIHEYFGVSQKILWNTVNNQIPIFKNLIKQILKDLE